MQAQLIQRLKVGVGGCPVWSLYVCLFADAGIADSCAHSPQLRFIHIHQSFRIQYTCC